MNAIVQEGRKMMGFLPLGSDLVLEFEKICLQHGVKLAEVRAIGSLSRAKISFYNQIDQKFKVIDLRKPLQILSLLGNISLQDGKPYMHAHITLGDESGQAFGGHVMGGSTVFDCEYVMQEYLSDEPLERHVDKETGLYFWPGKRL